MTLSWITVNKRLREASILINNTPLETFTYILNTISNNGAITEEDLIHINKDIKYDDDKLQLLVQSILHIYKKSILVVMKPIVLQKDLENKLKIEADKAEAFVKVWTEVTKVDFGDLDKRKKLDEVSWSLHLKTHSSHDLPGKQEIKPTAQLQLSLSDFENKCNEQTTLELDAQGLEDLYQTLESIQNKLDSVNSAKS